MAWEIEKNQYSFFSKDKRFASDYGDNLSECLVDVGNVFDSMDLLEIQKLYDAGFKLTDSYYSYDEWIRFNFNL
jgi:hypothetical protein